MNSKHFDAFLSPINVIAIYEYIIFTQRSSRFSFFFFKHGKTPYVVRRKLIVQKNFIFMTMLSMLA